MDKKYFHQSEPIDGSPRTSDDILEEVDSCLARALHLLLREYPREELIRLEVVDQIEAVMQFRITIGRHTSANATARLRRALTNLKIMAHFAGKKREVTEIVEGPDDKGLDREIGDSTPK